MNQVLDEGLKRRPALVVSNSKCSKLTGLLVIVSIMSKLNNKMIEYSIYEEVKHSKVIGYINPLQIHMFDYKKETLNEVIKLINNIINTKEL